MSLEIEIYNDGSPFMELVKRCHKAKPKEEDLRELRQTLVDQPELFTKIFPLAKAIRQDLAGKIAADPVAKAGLLANLKVMRGALGYDQAPELERLLIENILTSWMRLQWVEYHLSGFMGQSASMEVIRYWERRLSEAQKRHLRAVETLARVRKMALPALQLNIAQDGGQQVNVAGDLVRPAR